MKLIDKILKETEDKVHSIDFKKVLLQSLPKGDFNTNYPKPYSDLIIDLLGELPEDDLIEDLFVYKGIIRNLTLQQLSYWQSSISDEGSFSQNKPLYIFYHKKKFILIDGYHRIYEKLLKKDFSPSKCLIITLKDIKDYFKEEI